MSTTIDTVLLIHLPSIWETTNRRYAFRALVDTLPENVAVVCVDRHIDFIVSPFKRTGRFFTKVWRLGDWAENERLRIVRARIFQHEIPAARLPGITAVNRLMLRRQLQSVIRRRFPDARRIIQWIHHPRQSWVYRIFPEAEKVYHCYDEYNCSDDGRFHPDRWEREKQVLQEAGVTFITSESLRHRREEIAELHLIPNGIPEFFFDKQPPAPDPIDQIPQPRIGYLGNIFSLLDYGLLHEICLRRPDWQLVFVGPIQPNADIDRLRRLPNAHFVGVRPHENLPAILQRFAVGLMPFLINDFTRPLVPLKLYEYLAAGVPVVSTDLPNLGPFQSQISIVPGEAGLFAEAIAAELAKDRATTAARLREFAREFTWRRINEKYVVPVLREAFDI